MFAYVVRQNAIDDDRVSNARWEKGKGKEEDCV